MTLNPMHSMTIRISLVNYLLKEITTHLDVLGVVDLHPWSPRNLIDPLYIRLYFLSPLLFFGSLLAFAYQKEERRSSRPKESISWCSILWWRRNQASIAIRADWASPGLGRASRRGFVRQSGLSSCLCSSP